MPPILRNTLLNIYLSLISLASHVARYFFFILAFAFTLGLFAARLKGAEYSLVEVWTPFVLYLLATISFAMQKLLADANSIRNAVVFLYAEVIRQGEEKEEE